jgi:limonene-1,2-epoxide hydrolase
MAEATNETANGHVDERERLASPTVVVERFLELLGQGEVDQAVELLGMDVEYENVGLPTIHGRERVRRLFRAMMRLPGARFEAYVHTISADGPSVMTERTDVLELSRVRVQLWVCGRFDVKDGQIVLWRDYFDYVAFTVAMARGILGAVFPAVRAKPLSQSESRVSSAGVAAALLRD